MKYRVIQWGTGFVGKLALQATIERPDLELVGLVVNSPDKVGRDAGAIAGLPPTGVVGGRPRIIVEHVTRMHPDVAPEWPRSEHGDVYRILIDGNPSITSEIAFRGADGDHNSGGCLSTATRALNAIPAVCAAPPGLLTPFDLPLIAGRHTMR